MLSEVDTITHGGPVTGGVLVAMLLVPALVAVAAFTLGGRWPRAIGQIGVLAAALGFFGATALTVRAAQGDAAAVAIGVVGWSADRLAGVLLLLVFGLSTVIQAFAVRYLAGDRRAGWFAAGAGLLTSASAGLMTAATLIGLAASWTVAGVALCLLLGTYWQLPAARDGVRRTATAFLIGDLALWAAVALATAEWGAIDLRDYETQRLTGPVLPVVACLMVVAALSRSAQIPFHRWLPATLAAPTPVSALLHAGVVNAGGVLLIRVSPLVSGVDLARGLAVLAGAATMIYAAVLTLVKPDIKGALAHSTMAQMGFMTLTCGLGLWAAAVFHLVAHGFYKATLFMSSGSAIAHHRRLAAVPPAQPVTGRRKTLRAISAVSLPAVALGLAVLAVPLPPGDHFAEQALLVFAWVAGAASTWGWLHRRPGTAGVLTAAAFLLPVALGYVGLVSTLSGFLSADLPVAALPASMTWLIIVSAVVALGALAALRWAPGTGLPGRLQRTLYTRALSTGHVAALRPPAPSLPTRLTGAPS